MMYLDKELIMQGYWMWTEDWKTEDKEHAALVLFRTEIAEPVDDAALKITADTRYKLYVNGQHVQSGPSKGDDHIRYIDEAVISFQEQRNVIAIEVLKYPAADPENSNHSLFTSEMPGLYIEGFDPADYGSEWKSYTARNTEFYAEEKGFAPLHIHEKDAADPKTVGWKAPRFDDADWSGVILYGDEEVPEILRPENFASRTIPYMRMTERRFASCNDPAWSRLICEDETVVLAADSETEVVLDAGEEMTAFPVMKMSAGAGAEIEILYSECYVLTTSEESSSDDSYGPAEKGNRLDSVNGVLEGYTDHFRIMESGEWEYEPFWMRTFRFVRVRIRTGREALKIKSFAFEETGYPLEVMTEVRTSDESLADIWDISVRTLRRCMHETYMDGPFYEQLQYIMDTRAQILYTYSVAADDRLARQAIDDFRRSQRPDGLLNACYPNRNANVIPGFSMFYILMLYDHMMYFGDRELIVSCMDSVDRALGFFDAHIEADGMVGKIGGVNGENPYWSFVDWAEEWMPTIGMPAAAMNGPDTLQNLIYVMGLQAAAELAEFIDDAAAADRYEERAEDVIEAVRLHCMNDDGLLTDGTGCSELSQHAQVLGVLTGLYDEEEARRAMDKCMNESGFARCSVAWNYYLFRALEQTGLYYLTDRCWDTWRKMIANGCTTCVESEKYPRSECHAWGALAMYELPSAVLGVRPAAPGYSRIAVDPVPGYLDYAEGTVHTPHGDISVSWSRDSVKIKCADDVRARII